MSARRSCTGGEARGGCRTQVARVLGGALLCLLATPLPAQSPLPPLRRQGKDRFVLLRRVIEERNPANGDTLRNPIILPGDVLHIDFGISAMGLRTDTRHMAYVLQPGETAALDSAGATRWILRRQTDFHLVR